MSERIKFEDPKLEQAHALADAVQEWRQPACQAMRLGDLVDAFASAKPDAQVEFDFGGLQPSGIHSYRGYYSDLALGFGESGQTSTQLLTELRAAVGGVFEGYKGGQYRMDRSTPVWVANWGRSHGVAVVGIDDQGWRVVIRTAMIE